jgi:hypothetical protein
MSLHIVDDEQPGDRRVTPMRPLGSGLAGTRPLLLLGQAPSPPAHDRTRNA